MKRIYNILYWNVTGLWGSNLKLDDNCLIDSANIRTQAIPVNSIAPIAIGQKSFGVPSIQIGLIIIVITIVQSQKCKAHVGIRLAMLWDAINKNITATPNNWI